MILNFEQELSLKIHEKGVPILISSLLLRSYGAGQIDVAILQNSKIHLIEVKTQGDISFKQIQRLKKSAQILTSILKRNVLFWGVKKSAPYWYHF